MLPRIPGWKSQTKRMVLPRRALTLIRKVPRVFPLEPELNLWPEVPLTLWRFAPAQRKVTSSRRRALERAGEKELSRTCTDLAAARAPGSSAPDAPAAGRPAAARASIAASSTRRPVIR